MAITAPPIIPQITDPATFAPRAQAWVVWQAEQLFPFIIDASQTLGLSTNSTSVTSNTIGLGAKTFTVETGKGYVAGQSLSIARTSAPTNRMFAVVTSYNTSTGALIVDVQATEGIGTFTEWSIALAFNALISDAQFTRQTGQAFNESISTIASSTTPDIWTNTSNLINYTGTTTATGFAAAPQAGVRRTLILTGASSFTAGANMLIDGVVSFTGAGGDEVEVFAVTTTQFRLRPKKVNGRAIVESVTQFASSAEIKTASVTNKSIAPDQLLLAQGFTDFFESAEQTVTSAGLLTIAHGLGRTPKLIMPFLIFKTAVDGYSIGDIVATNHSVTGVVAGRGIAVLVDATNIVVKFGTDANVFGGSNKTTGVSLSFANTNVRLLIKVWG